ncbi:MAG TPA: lysylphosphatidylglycerol synthase domain-containing protein [Vicinamibacterales bacterium]|nr:lysylphosphatidylglycerol synthase domain-containing protein [Vicinamibacterales bacterium]
MRHQRRATLLTLIVAAASLVLFAYTLRQAGMAEIADGIRRLGWGGFLAILALSGIRLVVRSLAWMRCVEGPRPLRFADALDATLMGDALGNITPLANLLSEPSKAVFVRGRVPFNAALAGIVVENIIYTASVALMIGLGASVFLVAFQLPEELRAAAVGALAGVGVVVAAAYVILRTRARPVAAAAGWLRRRGVAPAWLDAWTPRLQRFEEGVGSFTTRNRRHLVPLLLYESAFHLAGVAEVFVTLSLILPGEVTIVTALVVESTGRVINVLFKFVPFRVGVDEAGNALLALPLGLPPASLVSLALVRKARILVWTAAGVALLLRRGLSVRRALHEAHSAATAVTPPS